MTPPAPDDERWLDALAGRQAAGRADPTGLEAGHLRDALQHLDAAPTQALDAAAEQAMLDRLLAQAAAEPRRGLCPGCARRWVGLLDGLLLHPWRGAALAGLGLVVAVGLWQRPPDRPDPSPERAAPASRVVLLQHAQPRQRRDELARQLGAAGARVQRYERLGRFGLDAQFPLPLGAEAARQLAALQLAADGDGVLRLEVEEAPP